METIGELISQGIMYAGVDVGYGLVKTMVSRPGGIDKKSLMMASAVATGTERGLTEFSEEAMNLGKSNGLIEKQLDRMDVEICELATDKVGHYFLGRLALEEGEDTHYCWEKDKSVDEDAKALLLSQLALAQLMYSNGESCKITVRLATGLPVREFLNKKDSYAINYLGEYTVSFKSGPFKGKHCHLNIEVNRPVPQSFGIYYDTVYTDTFEVTDSNLLLGQTLVLDIGYRTVDYSMIYQGRIINPSDSFEPGMNDAYKTVSKNLKEKQGIVADEKEIQRSFLYNNGVLLKNKNEIGLNKSKDKAIKQLANQLNNEIQNRIGAHLDKVNRVLIGGGGGEELFDLLTLPNKEKVVNAQFGNASGFLKYIIKKGSSR